jgi:3-oxoadipate enol-lactonase
VLSTFLVSADRFEKVMRHSAALKSRLVDQYSVEGLTAIYDGAIRHDATSLLSRIRVPTQVVGGAEDMLFPPRISQELARCIPQAEVVLLATAHVPPVEDPSLFNQTLRNFLSRVEHSGEVVPHV